MIEIMFSCLSTIRYTMANDICIIKVYFDSCDYPVLNPIRVVMDESTTLNGQYTSDIFIYRI